MAQEDYCQNRDFCPESETLVNTFGKHLLKGQNAITPRGPSSGGGGAQSIGSGAGRDTSNEGHVLGTKTAGNETIDGSEGHAN